MVRQKLQTKEEGKGLTIRKTASKAGYVAQHDPASYPLLTDNRYDDEKFSRICKFFVNHYYLIGTEWLCEKIFYPSSYGFIEIDDEKDHPYIKLRNQLRDKGIGLWGERPKPNIYKKRKRLQLKCKPKRMALTCKE